MKSRCQVHACVLVVLFVAAQARAQQSATSNAGEKTTTADEDRSAKTARVDDRQASNPTAEGHSIVDETGPVRFDPRDRESCR